ncbi:hypothetical protein HBI56_035040 [Parastagonospora nodorum]|nr:hypothetical protein HBH56_022850 [Parastagonospora nodorum]KAH3944213.1 hypothetical protein HBH53_165100 [Parastagonospora nodorum]KAH4011555.1 hypothetical protein HBI13_199020 [Parastagonospora nodorum]KAH4044258.1 hypothetical protein HBH49_222070 [Parastagonospora nodorum]KAH4137302.1 hypothetical protein HBH45_129150 [Parastagonospora nodorum]
MNNSYTFWWFHLYFVLLLLSGPAGQLSVGERMGWANNVFYAVGLTNLVRWFTEGVEMKMWARLCRDEMQS